MLSKDITPTPEVYATLMSAYAFHGSPELIRELMAGMDARSISVTRGMVSALADAYAKR